ncbi:MAG: hypothetical protein ACRDFA_11660 [bacterium]
MTIDRILIGTLALLVTTALASAGMPDPQNPTGTLAQSVTTTLMGCLYEEESVPGRDPNIAEQAGILEDYILADATTQTRGAEREAVGTTGTTPAHGNMYKVEHIDDERLRALVGERVEVTGRIDVGGSAPPPPGAEPAVDRSVGPDEIELPEFEAASIREVSGTCPATPAPRR